MKYEEMLQCESNTLDQTQKFDKCQYIDDWEHLNIYNRFPSLNK